MQSIRTNSKAFVIYTKKPVFQTGFFLTFTNKAWHLLPQRLAARAQAVFCEAIERLLGKIVLPGGWGNS